ncbi:hypothetical protein V6B08_00110 [Ferrovibrio sp. MS7]|uniref:hypothetical protein n=1 Tax=Ferrovibrio plantarum TaxID=3119164 RepID=UPI003136D515
MLVMTDFVLPTAYLFLKVAAVWVVGKGFSARFSHDCLTALLAAWMMVNAGQNALILALSAFDALSQPAYVICALLTVAAAHAAMQLYRFQPAAVADIPPARLMLPLGLLAILLVLFWLRSGLGADYTWDAQTYGVPRLAIWLNYGTVFVHMPTIQLNLFVNEWNGELNALAYGLAAGSYAAFNYANLEVLAGFMAVVFWLTRLLGAPIFTAMCMALLLGSMPAILGLATTLKGDLLGCVGFLFAAGWLLRLLLGDRSGVNLALLLLAASWAFGAKISVLLPLLVLVAVAGLALGRDLSVAAIKLPRSVLLWAGAGLLIFSSRFWTNWIVYGNPMQRVDVEKVAFQASYVLDNLVLAFARIFPGVIETPSDHLSWALSNNMGGTAWFLCGALLLWAGWRRFTIGAASVKAKPAVASPRLLPFLLAGVAAAVLVTMFLSPAFNWNFRYFLPGLLLLFMAAGARLVAETRWQFAILTFCSVIVVAINVALAVRPGEIVPSVVWQQPVSRSAAANTPIKRLLRAYDFIYQTAAVDELRLDTDKALEILIYKEFAPALLPFIGSQAQNRLTLVATINDLLAKADLRRWDIVVVAALRGLRDPGIAARLEQRGYWVAVDNEQYVIAVPRRRVELTKVADLSMLQWQTWGPAGVDFSIADGQPRVSSDSPVDAGFISQPLNFKGSFYVKAAFAGQLTGNNAASAHVSLHGREKLVSLAPGSYRPGQQYIGLANGQAGPWQGAVSFGLGGWSRGSGDIRLVALDVFTFRITDQPSRPNGVTPQSYWLLAVFGMAMVGAAAFLGRTFLLACGIGRASHFGTGLVVGYALLGLAAIYALRLFGSMMPAAILLFAAAGHVLALRHRGQSGLVPAFPRFTWAGAFIGLITISWVVAVAAIYWPVAMLGDAANYRFPEIYDLPKHFFALQALYEAQSWPPENAFFKGEAFAYNFLYYAPAALLAQLSGPGQLSFAAFWLVVVVLSVAVPVVALELAQAMTASRMAHVLAVLLATWAGGGLPLLIDAVPAIGFAFFRARLILDSIWVDEVFISYIFVPQHLLVVLVGLCMMLLLANASQSATPGRSIALAGLLAVAAALGSLILLPHILLSYVLLLLLFAVQLYREQGLRNSQAALVGAALLPLPLLVPFLAEALLWGSGADVAFFGGKAFSVQWLYVLAAFGMALPLALVGAVAYGRGYARTDDSRRLVVALLVLFAAGLLFYLFGAYPDAGLKSGLWLRVVAVPLAIFGLMALVERRSLKIGNLVLGLAALAMLLLTAINIPTVAYYMRGAWLPGDASHRALIAELRRLPRCADIVMFGGDQITASVAGRRIDFDFSRIRSDSYMAPEGRQRAAAFWAGLARNEAAAWSALEWKYDFILSPAGRPEEAALAARYALQAAIGPYRIYRVKPGICSPA